MATKQIVSIECDGCGFPLRREEFDSIPKARTFAFAQQWITVFRNNMIQDLCPMCKNKRKEQA